MKKYFRGVMSCLKYALVVAVLTFGAWYITNGFKQIDDEKILRSSPLKDKNFSVRVQKVASSGLSAYLFEEHSVPIVSIDFKFLNSGWALENEEKQGLAKILTLLLEDGAGEYDADEFKEICDEYGIQIGFVADADDISGYVNVPRQNLDMALKLLTAVLYKPLLPSEYLALAKQKVKTAVKISRENPAAVLADEFAQFIMPNHPYARPDVAKLTTVDNITEADLRSFMQEHFCKSNLKISFAGDLSATEAKDILDKVFARLPDEYLGAKIVPQTPQLGGRTHNIKYDSAQVISRFAVAGVRREEPDFYPLYLANYVFGGSGLSSRISQIIREKEGLTYGIYTDISFSDAVALLQGSYSATPDNFDKAQKLLLQEWQKMAQQGVSAQELQKAKDALVASFNLRFASIGGIASMLTGMQKYNLGIDFLEKRNDYIKNVTLSEVNAAAKKYFSVTPDFVSIGIEK